MIAEGKNAHLYKKEIGQHVIQRCPPTENKGRVHTSAINVFVMELKEESAFKLRDSDIDIKTQGGSGPGGQHQNKSQCAVRMTHIPTNIQVYINGRSQYDNKKEARRILESRVESQQAEINAGIASKTKRSQLSYGKRRTYNFVESRITDHITGKRTDKLKKVMKGHLDLVN